MDARERRRSAFLAPGREALAPVEELKGKAIASAADDEPLRHGPGGSGFGNHTPRRDDDEAPERGFGGPQNAKHGAVKRARKPCQGRATCKPQHGEQGCDDGLEDFAVALGPGARLDWLPQETILFDGSALRRTITADLAKTASLLMVEALIFGRAAMGETIGNALFSDRWRIRREGRLIHADDLKFEGSIARLLGRSAIAGGAGALATVALFSDDADALIDPFRRHHPHTAASAFNGKFLARFAAVDGYSLRKSLIPALEFLCAGRALPKLWAI